MALLLAALGAEEPGATPASSLRDAGGRSEGRAGTGGSAAPQDGGTGWRSALPWAAPALVALVAAAQCLPLPAALLRAVAPVTWEIRSLAPAPAQAWAPLSLDGPATLASLALPVLLACAAAAAGLLGPRWRRLLCGAAVGGAAMQLAVALVQAATGAGGGVAVLAGSFVNRNHLAALLCGGAVTAAGAALAGGRKRADRPRASDAEPAREPGPARPGEIDTAPARDPGAGIPRESDAALARDRRLLWAAGAAVLSIATLLTLSRGGAAALVAGLGGLALVRPGPRASGDGGRALFPRGRRAGLAAVFAAAVLGGALWLAAGPLASRAAQLGDLGKLRSFVGAAALVRDHPLFGVGRGAYRYLSERHRSVPGEVTFAYVEDEPLQLAADLGLPVALLVLAALWLAWRRGLFAAASGLERGAAWALFSLGVQNLVDFDLELAGVALPAAVMLGALAGGPLSRRAVAALLCAAPLACAALVWSGPRSAEREAEALLALDPRELPAAAAAAVVRHPADWLVSLAPALRLADPRLALAWAGRAMALAPQAWRPHAAAASVLLRLGARSQARIETRLALSGGRYSQVPWDAIGLAAQAARGLEQLQEATPDEAPVRATLVEKLRAVGRDAEALALAEAEVGRGASGAARLQLLTQLASLAPDRWAPLLAQEAPCAGALWLSRASGSDGPLLEGLRRCPGDRALGEEVVRRRLARGEAASAQAALDGLDTQAWPVEAHLLSAQVQDALGRPTRALAERWLAAELAPDRPELALDYADRLDQAGDRAGAREALGRLSARATGPAKARLESRLRALGE